MNSNTNFEKMNSELSFLYSKLCKFNKKSKHYALYLKFYYKNFNQVHHWYNILNQIDYDLVDVYIWLFDFESKNILNDVNIIKCKEKYPKIIFVTNYNENEFLSSKDLLFLQNFQNKKNLKHMLGHAISHLKAFLIPKNVEYIFNIDADDIFYPNFDVNLYNIIYQYMYNNKKKILTRPFHQWNNRGWSFGFTIACSDILDFINPNQIEGINWYNTDTNKAYNLDNLFGHILLIKYKIAPNELYFGLKNYNWRQCEMNYLKSINAIMI